MQNDIYEKICHNMRKILMKPLNFQDANLTVIDVHTLYYDIHDYTVPRHSHPWYEFIYIISGTFINIISGKERICSAGEAFLIAPGIEHAHRTNGLDFSRQFCVRFQLAKNNDSNTFYGNFYEELVRLFSNLEIITTDLKFELLSEKVSADSTYKSIAGCWDWLLGLCEGKFDNTDKTESQKKTIVYQTNLYIEKNYMYKINAEKIAQLLNVSYRTLARHFKNETGITINQKINNVRLSAAKTLLLNTDDSIQNIALQVGYSDEFYFSNLFKKETDISPMTFRKKFKKTSE